MATGTVELPPHAVILPDGTANNAPAALVRVKSSATSSSTNGAPFFYQLNFDASTDEMVYWQIDVPQDYSSAPALRVLYKMASATTGTVVVEGRVAAVTDGDATDVDAKALATTNASSAVTVPGTAGHLDVITVTLTNADSLTAGDFAIITLRRDADSTNATDNATGDMEVVMASLTYTTT